MLFICQSFPYLRVYNPDTEGFVEFQGGKLQLDEGDPDFGIVMAEAQRNPLIRVLSDARACPECGELFDGKGASLAIGRHRKAQHLDAWAAEREVEGESRVTEIKRLASHVCDLCSPVQEFRDDDELARHMRNLHLTVEVDDDGNVRGSGEGSAAAEPQPARAR